MRRGYFTPPVLIILAVIIFGVAILIAINTDLVKRLKKEPTPTPVSSPTLSPLPTTQSSSSTSDETANWKTYMNQKSGFSIKYPPNAQIIEELEDGYGVVKIESSEINTKVSISVKTKEVADLFSSVSFKSCSEKGGEISNVIISGVEIKKCIRKNPENIVLVVTDDFSKSGQIIYDMVLMVLRPAESNIEGLEVFNQILSTFKFLD